MKVVGMRGVVLRPQYIAEGIAGAIPRCPQELSHFSLVIPVANQRNLTSVWFLEPLQSQRKRMKNRSTTGVVALYQ